MWETKNYSEVGREQSQPSAVHAPTTDNYKVQ